MWQRIQSVFIGLAILCLLAALFQPLWEGIEGDMQYRLYPIYLMEKAKDTPGTGAAPNYVPFCLTAVLMVAAITIAIQQFRRFDDRILQIKLGSLNSALIAITLICAAFFPKLVIQPHPALLWKYDPGIFLIVVAAIFNWLGVRFIRRDEKIVRDSDRLR